MIKLTPGTFHDCRTLCYLLTFALNFVLLGLQLFLQGLHEFCIVGLVRPLELFLDMLVLALRDQSLHR